MKLICTTSAALVLAALSQLAFAKSESFQPNTSISLAYKVGEYSVESSSDKFEVTGKYLSAVHVFSPKPRLALPLGDQFTFAHSSYVALSYSEVELKYASSFVGELEAPNPIQDNKARYLSAGWLIHPQYLVFANIETSKRDGYLGEWQKIRGASAGLQWHMSDTSNVSFSLGQYAFDDNEELNRPYGFKEDWTRYHVVYRAMVKNDEDTPIGTLQLSVKDNGPEEHLLVDCGFYLGLNHKYGAIYQDTDHKIDGNTKTLGAYWQAFVTPALSVKAFVQKGDRGYRFGRGIDIEEFALTLEARF